MVLGRLPVPSILNVAGTCQEMRSLSNDPSLWQHLVFRDFGKYRQVFSFGWLVILLLLLFVLFC